MSVHRDCHVQFDARFYSVPFTLVGQSLWLRATDTAVAIYQDYRHVHAPPRAAPGPAQHGARPPAARRPSLLRSRPHWCVQQAAEVGPACADLIERLLADRIVERLRAAQGVLRSPNATARSDWKPPALAHWPTTASSIAPSRPFSPAASISNR